MDETDISGTMQEADAAEISDERAEERSDLILSLPVPVRVVLGSTTLPVAKLLKLGRGAVIELDERVGDPVDLTVSGRVVARGELVVLDEENSRYGISLTEVVGAPAGRSIER